MKVFQVGKENYEYKIGAKIENIALLDDEVDWLIFKKLAIKKIGNNAIDILNKITPYKRISSFDTTNEIFVKYQISHWKIGNYSTKSG